MDIVSNNRTRLQNNSMDCLIPRGNETSPKFEFVTPFDFLHWQVIFSILYGCVFFFIITGNSLVIFAILRHKRMKTNTNCFLANLAGADICVGVFCVIPNLVSYFTQHWYAGWVMCKLYHYIDSVSYSASILLLTAMSIERYVAIMLPHLKKSLTGKKMVLLAVGIWLLAGGISLPSLLAYDTVHITEKGQTVHFCFRVNKMRLDIQATAHFAIFFCLPFIAMAYTYGRIGLKLWGPIGSNLGNIGAQKYSLHRRLSGTCSNINKSNMHSVQSDPGCCHNVSFTISKVEKALSVDNVSKADLTVAAKYACRKNARPQFDDSRMLNSTRKSNMPLKIRRMKTIVSTQSGLSEDGTEFRPNLKETNESINNTNLDSVRYTGLTLHHHSSRALTYLPPQMNERQSCSKKSSGSLRIRNKVMHTRQRTIRMMTAMVISFAIFTLPNHALILHNYWSTNFQSAYIHTFGPPTTSLILYLNNCFNPLLYALMSDNFQRVLWKPLKQAIWARHR